MLRFTKIYEHHADYEAEKLHRPVHSISVCLDEMSVNPGDTYIKPHYKSFAESKVGDIVLYKPETEESLFVSSSQYSQTAFTGFIPQAIVVIPYSHTNDGTVKVMSLNIMSFTNPSSGSTTSSTSTIMHYGGMGYLIPEIPCFTVVPSIDTLEEAMSSNPTVSLKQLSVRIPYAGGAASKRSGLDPYAYYYPGEFTSHLYGLSPYLGENQAINPQYLQGGTSIINGFENTQVLVALHKQLQPNLDTDSTVMTGDASSKIYSPAACCYKYETEMIKQGRWYLPCLSEVAYLSSRISVLTASLNSIPSSMRSVVFGRTHCSTQRDANQYIWMNVESGAITNQPKSYRDNIYTRAFASLRA